MTKLKYYYDLLSQPSRALWIGLKYGKTPFEDCPVALRKREQLTEEYKKINRLQKVPALVHGNFHLSESVAMVRYLADNGMFSTDLYPKDVLERARVDEFLEWQHLTLRYGCGTYFMRCWLLPINGLGHMPSEDAINEIVQEMEKHLKTVEKIWLRDTKFVSGNKLSIADLIGASEIEQIKLCKYNVSLKFPRITDWLSRVREETNPFYDEAHKFLNIKASS